jgi:PAS domain S-box-containing protein
MLFLFTSALFVAGGIILFLLRDISRQRRTLTQAEQQLAQSAKALHVAERRHELMFSANPYPMWIYDCETLRFLKVNDAAVKAYGYSREEFLNMTVLDIRPPDDASAFLEHANSHRGYCNAGHWRHLYKDGSIATVEVLTFEHEVDGRPQKLILALDVSERCRIEEALRESEASLKSLLESAPFGIAQSSIEGNRFKTLNAALRRILGGYSLEEALQLNIAQQVYADWRERDKLIEILHRHGKVEGWEISMRKRDGTTVPVRISGSLGKEEGGEDVIHAYVEDITQQSTLEQQVRQVQKLEAVGRLAGGMAHDFNNVLVVIKLSTELMLDQTTPDSPFSKPLLQISNAADRAASLTRQMLAFSRQQMMQPRIVNLNSIVNETTLMLRRVIGEDIQLVTTLADDVENSRLDPDQVTQVILNLAVNARDAMPNGGMLQLETATVNLDEGYAGDHPAVQAGRYAMLAVSDTGMGIDKSILPRIFDPFFTTKEQGKGTGLGLSIVYGIVKQSGGYVWVYSEVGQGTTFKIYFPTTTASPERHPLRTGFPVSPANQTLLLVEDDATIRSNIRDCLQQLGYHVLEAENGAAALELCAELQGKVDLVLTDLVMAGKGGHELSHDLAELYPAIRVLFMSGYSEDSAARRDILLRGSPFLQKPFSVADLAKAVETALAFNLSAV